MKAIRHSRLALVFALLSCIIPPLDKAIAETYPGANPYFDFDIGNLTREDDPAAGGIGADRPGKYKGYTIRERVRAGVSLLGFACCLLAFFIGRAGVAGPPGKKRDIYIIAGAIGMCSSASYAGVAIFLVLFLVFMLGLQKKDGIPAEQ